MLQIHQRCHCPHSTPSSPHIHSGKRSHSCPDWRPCYTRQGTPGIPSLHPCTPPWTNLLGTSSHISYWRWWCPCMLSTLAQDWRLSLCRIWRTRLSGPMCPFSSRSLYQLQWGASGGSALTAACWPPHGKYTGTSGYSFKCSPSCLKLTQFHWPHHHRMQNWMFVVRIW